MPKLLTRNPMQRRVEEHAAIVRNTMRKVKIKDTTHKNLWRELVYPLRRERAKVQTGIDYYARKPTTGRIGLTGYPRTYATTSWQRTKT